MKTTRIRTYSELITLDSFEDRFKYLALNGIVGDETFGFDRIFNQMFYTSKDWYSVRQKVIVRDHGCDLAHSGHSIPNGVQVFVHHMNPIDISDIRDATDYLMNPEYLITTILNTHNAIHYGDYNLIAMDVIERKPFDTCPWRKGVNVCRIK